MPSPQGVGVHTQPQFEWRLTRMPRRPQPVPPIFQPEVAAERSCGLPIIAGAASCEPLRS